MSGERFTLDTNILVYSTDARDLGKRASVWAVEQVHQFGVRRAATRPTRIRNFRLV
ncbi:MAG TPA: hypothetical protein VHX61_20610 [Rhizomicrobium sp.]|jgi:hypothetical protein|nr:hypothetical protein [Rhizomicrobium sp.]